MTSHSASVEYEAPPFEKLVHFAGAMTLGCDATESQKEVVRRMLEQEEPVRAYWLQCHRDLHDSVMIL